jgi:hypothetical protein
MSLIYCSMLAKMWRSEGGITSTKVILVSPGIEFPSEPDQGRNPWLVFVLIELVSPVGQYLPDSHSRYGSPQLADRTTRWPIGAPNTNRASSLTYSHGQQDFSSSW